MRPAILSLGALIVTLCGCGSSSHNAATQGASLTTVAPRNAVVPGNRLIVPARSMGDIRVGEPRKLVARALGPGKRIGRYYRSYLHGRLRILYSYHDAYTGLAQALITRWSGYRTRSGVHVGSPRRALDGLHLTCFNRECRSGGNPDHAGTLFTLRHGLVSKIYVGAS